MTIVEAGRVVIPSGKHAGQKLGIVVLEDEEAVFAIARDKTLPQEVRDAASMFVVQLMSPAPSPSAPSPPSPSAPEGLPALTNEKFFDTRVSMLQHALNVVTEMQSAEIFPIGYHKEVLRFGEYRVRLRARSDKAVMMEIEHPQCPNIRYPFLLDQTNMQQLRMASQATLNSRAELLFPRNPRLLFGAQFRRTEGDVMKVDDAFAAQIEGEEEVEFKDRTGRRFRFTGDAGARD